MEDPQSGDPLPPGVYRIPARVPPGGVPVYRVRDSGPQLLGQWAGSEGWMVFAVGEAGDWLVACFAERPEDLPAARRWAEMTLADHHSSRRMRLRILP